MSKFILIDPVNQHAQSLSNAPVLVVANDPLDACVQADLELRQIRSTFAEESNYQAGDTGYLVYWFLEYGDGEEHLHGALEQKAIQGVGSRWFRRVTSSTALND